jgi:hypothetical protein
VSQQGERRVESPAEAIVKVQNRRQHRWAATLAIAAGVSTAAVAAVAALPCPTPASEIASIRALLAQDVPAALDRTEALAAACPGQRALQRLLAAARRATGDLSGAVWGLRAHLAADPLDCESWSWLAWLELERGEPALTWQALQAPCCPDTRVTGNRLALLEAWLRADLKDPTAAAALARVGDTSELWPEDGSLQATLERRFDRAWQPPATIEAEVGLGATSDAFAGSPVDTTRSGVGSALGRVHLSGHLAAPRRGPLTPFVAVDVKGHGIADEEARELSYLELGGRVGAELVLRKTHVRLAFRHEVLFLDVPANARYSLANRGELEVELPGGAMILAGGGHREYLDPWRTRRELDAVAALPLMVGRLPMTAGFSLRAYAAARDVYNQRGAALTLLASPALGRSLVGRLAIAVARDDYPDSGDLDGLLAFGSLKARRDLTARLILGVTRPLGARFTATLSLEHARRWSTIDPGLLGSFAYRENRLMLTLAAGLAGSPWRVHAAVEADHVPLDYGPSDMSPAFGVDRVRELLQQDEELRQDCGCTPH